MDLSTLNTFQQAILFVLLILGSAILISSTVLIIRKRAFEVKFKHALNSRVASRQISSIEMQTRAPLAYLERSSGGDVNGRGNSKPTATVEQATIPSSSTASQIHWVDDDQVTNSNESRHQNHHHHHHQIFHMVGVGARGDIHNHPRDIIPVPYVGNELPEVGLKGVIRGTWKYHSFKGQVSRNSQFHGLSAIEREELGGAEYKAVAFLSWIVSLYFIVFIILGIISVGGWLQANHPEVSQENGLDPFWTGAFFAVSAFVNSGMSLLDKNMTALQLK